MGEIIELIMYKIESKNSLRKDQADYIRYGLDVMLSTLLNLVCITVVSLIFGELLLGLVFVLVFVPIRSFTGGYHANTKIRCNLSVIAVLVFCIVGTGLLSKLPMNILPVAVAINSGIYILFFVLLAPVEHHNKPLSEEKRNRNKKLGWVSTGIAFLAEGLTFVFARKICVCISLVLLVIGIFMGLGYWKGYLYKRKNAKS